MLRQIKAKLRVFNWYKNDLSNLIRNRDMTILVNKKDDKFNENLKFQNYL